MLNSKWTNKELLLIRLQNIAQWNEEDFQFYDDINRKLLDIIDNREIVSLPKHPVRKEA